MPKTINEISVLSFFRNNAVFFIKISLIHIRAKQQPFFLLKMGSTIYAYILAISSEGVSAVILLLAKSLTFLVII